MQESQDDMRVCETSEYLISKSTVGLSQLIPVTNPERSILLPYILICYNYTCAHNKVQVCYPDCSLTLEVFTLDLEWEVGLCMSGFSKTS